MAFTIVRKMIISRTPMRVSFFGGGTDLPSFYRKEFGCVISTTIDKYCYIVVHPSFDKNNLIKYSVTEITKNVHEIKHPLVREAMKLVGLIKGLEITSIAEVPSGTGLGSSSSFLVGLLNALHAYKGEYISSKQLAEIACRINLDVLKEPIGKQDQYAVAFGGLNFIQFNQDESVSIEPIVCKKELIGRLKERLLLFYLGKTREANKILEKQNKNTGKESTFEILRKMRDIALRMKRELNARNIDNFGRFLGISWRLKSQLAEGISNKFINKIYENAIKAGAEGGKLLGAGGAGFMLLYCDPKKQRKLRKKMGNFREIKFEFDKTGSRIIYAGN